MLTKARANLNLRDLESKTAVVHAAESRHANVVDHLVAQNAEVNQTDAEHILKLIRKESLQKAPSAIDPKCLEESKTASVNASASTSSSNEDQRILNAIGKTAGAQASPLWRQYWDSLLARIAGAISAVSAPLPSLNSLPSFWGKKWPSLTAAQGALSQSGDDCNK